MLPLHLETALVLASFKVDEMTDYDFELKRKKQITNSIRTSDIYSF